MSAAKQPPAKKAATPKKATAKKSVPAKKSAPLAANVDAAHATARTYTDRAAAKAAKRGRAAQREAFFREMHGPIDHAALAAAMSAHAFPGQNPFKWVPIGPTVTRRGQAMSRPRTSGRVRDLAVSPDGRRAYAISAKGGVWYTGDGGITWKPVGGWAGRSVNAQGNGNMFSGGSLLVDFTGGTAATDVVMVGTGEPIPSLTETDSIAQGGIGVLTAVGAATAAIDADPWEPDTGLAQLSGLGIYRLARRPGVTPLAKGASADQVLAGTTDGLFLGTRQALPAVAAAAPAAPGQPPQAALPARDGFSWAPCAAAAPALPGQLFRRVSDVLWLANGGGTRIVYAVSRQGVFYSDDNGTTPNPINPLQTAAVAFNGIISLAVVPGTNRVYVLAEVRQSGPPPANTPIVRRPKLFRINDVIAAPQVVVEITGVPTDLFGDPTKVTQADYDQAIAVEQVGTDDRIYLGGSTVKPRDDTEGQWSASLFCFQTPAPPAAVAALTPAVSVARTTDPPTGDGADRGGLIGNNVHADVHVIRLTGPAAPNRHVWVGCDGGVYQSQFSGRVNTFAARNEGLATLEPIFIGQHPTSSHFMLVGFQDNGSQVRVGDTVWELTFMGDGGGSAIHPIRSDIHISQWTTGVWNGLPSSEFVDPLTRLHGLAGDAGRETSAAAWASGVATVQDSATTARVALGTNRVWLTDHLGEAGGPAWRVLPYTNGGTEFDPRPSGTDPNANQAFGVPTDLANPAFTNATTNVSFAEQVLDLAWQNTTTLLVLYRGGVVRYTNTNRTTRTWTHTSWPLTGPYPMQSTARLTTIATVPGSLDFYVAALGDITDPTEETLWYWDDANNRFRPTGFRTVLDFAGPPVVAGPVDPVFSVAVDPDHPADLWVGTATGVWKGRKQNATTWVFVPFMNGLPQATVQDLRIWKSPAGAPTTLRMLRAGVQSRGMWEVDIDNPTPRHTYVRTHLRDDRRVLPTPMASPRRRPGSPDEPAFASPDIVVRPAWPFTTPPRFHSSISSGNIRPYDLWTFQTAFRWLYPSCIADGQWSDAMRDLVRFHRAQLGLSPGAVIDQALWDRVVGANGVRLLQDPNHAELATVSANAADPLAVYRAPWQTLSTFDAPATEIDLMESVTPVRTINGEWVVFREPSTVEVLLHHRDSRPVPPGSAFAILLWRHATTSAALLATGATDIAAYLTAVLAAPLTTPPADPAGWTVAKGGNGAAMRTLPTLLDARLPRAVSIDVDLSVVPRGEHVLFLAVVGSLADDAVAPPALVPTTVVDLARGWANAAVRLVQVTNRA